MLAIFRRANKGQDTFNNQMRVLCIMLNNSRVQKSNTDVTKIENQIELITADAG